MWSGNQRRYRLQLNAALACGDLVVGRYTLRGMHRGEFLGIPATGNSITVSNIHILRIVNGKIVEHSGHGDDMGMMRQVGAIPEPSVA